MSDKEMTLSEAMRIVTTEMADAWEDARPRRKGPYKDDADERQAHAEGNWLAMLDACEAWRHLVVELSASRAAAEAMREAFVKLCRDEAYNDTSTDHHRGYTDACETLASLALALPLPEAQAGWMPIESAPMGDEIFYAATADGRQIIVRGSILANMRRKDTPNHLQFPAIYWMPLLPLPSPPKE